MKVYNIKTINNFDNAINELAKSLDIVLDYNSISKNCYRIKLIKGNNKSKYQRLGFLINKDGNRKKVGRAICWHGYRDFIIGLYKLNPSIRIVSAQATYLNASDFNDKYPSTYYKNIGSVVEPLSYGNACTCKEHEQQTKVA